MEQPRPPEPRPRPTPPSTDYGRYRPADSPATFELLVATVCGILAGLGFFGYLNHLWPQRWGAWPLLACALLALTAARGAWRAWRRR